MPVYKSHRGHKASQTFNVCVCIFKTVCLGLFVCLGTLCVCVHTLLEELRVALLMAFREG